MIWTGAMVIGGLIWAIGSLSMISDLLNHGKSLKDYRKKYGKDLGMLVCCTHRGLLIAAWPVVGLGGFFIGIIRDTARLVTGRNVTKVEDEA